MRGTGGQAEKRRNAGTVLMEAVLCLPLLLLLVTGIVQFARIWETRLFVQYAAYNAARAALVYNPFEYADSSGHFRERRGPVFQAAVNTLAWKSATENSAAANVWFPGFAPGSRAPDSGNVWHQVHVSPVASWESNGLVCVSVRFDMPLLFKVFDPSWMFPAIRAGEEADPLAGLDSDATGLFPIAEACILPKPWSTSLYPLLADEERLVIADRHDHFAVQTGGASP